VAGGFAVRFLLEVVFLALLALAAGLAELDTAWVVALMGVGWLLVTLIEWLAWRSEVRGARAVQELVAAEPEADVEESTSWDIEEILAPLPEPEGGTGEPGAAS
jgi:hypothetical protein